MTTELTSTATGSLSEFDRDIAVTPEADDFVGAM